MLWRRRRKRNSSTSETRRARAHAPVRQGRHPAGSVYPGAEDGGLSGPAEVTFRRLRERLCLIPLSSEAGSKKVTPLCGPISRNSSACSFENVTSSKLAPRKSISTIEQLLKSHRTSLDDDKSSSCILLSEKSTSVNFAFDMLANMALSLFCKLFPSDIYLPNITSRMSLPVNVVLLSAAPYNLTLTRTLSEKSVLDKSAPVNATSVISHCRKRADHNREFRKIT